VEADVSEEEKIRKRKKRVSSYKKGPYIICKYKRKRKAYPTFSRAILGEDSEIVGKQQLSVGGVLKMIKSSFKVI
jgi:hypothetical protein